MGFGTDFKADIYLSRERFETMYELDSKIEETQDYIRIAREKILMGIANYGYDWTLPFTEGTPARSLSLGAAISLAREVLSEIKSNNALSISSIRFRDSLRSISASSLFSKDFIPSLLFKKPPN